MRSVLIKGNPFDLWEHLLGDFKETSALLVFNVTLFLQLFELILINITDDFAQVDLVLSKFVAHSQIDSSINSFIKTLFLSAYLVANPISLITVFSLLKVFNVKIGDLVQHIVDCTFFAIFSTPFLFQCDLDILLEFLAIFFDFSLILLGLIIPFTSLSHVLCFFLRIETCTDPRTAHLKELDCTYMVLLLILCH